jgi:hypothetical protein
MKGHFFVKKNLQPAINLNYQISHCFFLFQTRECLLQCISVNFSCKMNRALAVDRIPAGRIRTAEKLYLQADTNGRLGNGQSHDTLRRLPGGTAGGSSFNGDIFDFFVRDPDIEFRRAKAIAVFTQAVLPGKTASGGW